VCLKSQAYKRCFVLRTVHVDVGSLCAKRLIVHSLSQKLINIQNG